MEKDIVNWTERGFKPVVKNQGKGPYCSMTSLSAIISAVHYANDRDNAEIVDFSEQQLIDLFSQEEIRPGGINRKEMLGIMKDLWVTTCENYPAHKDDGEYVQGKYDINKVRPPFVKVLKMNRVVPENGESMEVAMMKKLEYHPIMGCMAVQKDLALYDGGIWGNPINHLMVIVGYGESIDTDTNTKNEYWNVLQSWGATWGIDGFMKIAKGKNTCKIERYAWYPTLGTYKDK